MTLAPGIFYALADIVGARHVVLPCDGCAAVGSVGLDAVVYPGSGGEVAQILRGAAACDFTVRLPDSTVLRQGSAGEIALVLTRLNEVVRVDPLTMVARVQPLVPRDRLSRVLSRARLQLAGAITTQGGGAGMVADCAVAVEAVTASGRIVRHTRKAVADRPDVIDLLLRMTGAPCVITEITLALSPELGEAKE